MNLELKKLKHLPHPAALDGQHTDSAKVKKWPVQDGVAEEMEEEETETARMFRQAAEALKEKREEDAMSVEERISKCGVDILA